MGIIKKYYHCCKVSEKPQMDKAEKVMTVIGPIIEKIVGLVTMILPFVVIGATAYYGYKWALQFYIES